MVQLRLMILDSPIVETPVMTLRPPMAVVAQPRTRGRYVLPPTPTVIYLPPAMPVIEGNPVADYLDVLHVLEQSKPDPLDKLTDDADPRQFQRMIEALEGVQKADGFWGMVGNCFQQMQIAEDEIAVGVRKVWPDQVAAVRVWGCFKTCRTDFPLNDVLFRAHCREIVQRAIDNQLHYKKHREPATLAELLHVMVQTSLATPLNQMGARIYWVLFRDVLPEQYQQLQRTLQKNGLKEWEWLPREDHYGATEQLLADLRQKYGWAREEGSPRLPSNPDVLEDILHAS